MLALDSQEETDQLTITDSVEHETRGNSDSITKVCPGCLQRRHCYRADAAKTPLAIGAERGTLGLEATRIKSYTLPLPLRTSDRYVPESLRPS